MRCVAGIEYRAESSDEFVVVFGARHGGYKLLVACEIIVTDRVHEPLVAGLVEHRDAEPRVAGAGINTVERAPAQLVPVEARSSTDHRRIRRDPCTRRVQQLGIHDRRVEKLALTGSVAMRQRLDHADRRQEAVARVTERRGRPHRMATIVETTVHPRGPRESRAGLVVARQCRPDALFEPPRMAVDQCRIDGSQRLVVDSEPNRCFVAHVVLHDVGLSDQLAKQLHAIGGFQIHGDAALAAVATHRDVIAHPVVVGERVHLDDLGTEIGQQLRTEGARDGEAKIEHANAFEGRANRVARRRQ